MFSNPFKQHLPTKDTALAGRDQPLSVDSTHWVLSTSITSPFPEGYESIVLGMGCFWGAERRFWTQSGVHTTAAGYSAGFTENPTYEEVCSGQTGHNEVVLVVFDPSKVSLEALLKVFWESHNPTQGMRQGNDKGTQYRSGIYCADSDQRAVVLASMSRYQQALDDAGKRVAITTEIELIEQFYYAETYHQQYLAKNPRGYCGLSGTGIDYCKL